MNYLSFINVYPCVILYPCCSFQSFVKPDFSFLNNRMATASSKTNIILNTRCCFQDNNSIIPPQLQGKSLANMNIAVIYKVKAAINPRLAYTPFNRQRGTTNRITIRNSTQGSKTATGSAAKPNIGLTANCSLKSEYSMSLAMPVYKNRMILSTTMISMMVVRLIMVIRLKLCQLVICKVSSYFSFA